MAAEAQVSYGTPLDSPPTDGISALHFAPTGELLLASSWDGTVRLYDAANNVARGTFASQAPVLDCAFADDTACFSGGLDNTVRRYDFVSQAESTVGRHEKPVRCLVPLRERGLLASAGWDASLRLWDPRAPAGSNCAGVVALPGKAYSMGAARGRLVVATSERHVLVFDLRNIESGHPEQTRESSLKFQTRCVAPFPDGSGYALASVEGRVAMEYYDQSEEVQAKKYAFKCHRTSEGGRDIVYPINAISFHSGYGTFATGGCDGVVNVWDGENKKRLMQISRYPTSVSALSFNAAGTLLAVASSYTYEQGEKEHPADAIYVRAMADSQVRPKPRKGD